MIKFLFKILSKYTPPEKLTKKYNLVINSKSTEA